MTISIREADPREPGAHALLKASHALMQSLFAPEENHFLSVEALAGPGIDFWVAEENGAALGCVALAHKNGYGEVKSMFVADNARGKGVGAALIDHLIARGRDSGLPMLKLETGDLLKTAHRLYARHGFTLCGPFGDYETAPSSVFMERTL